MAENLDPETIRQFNESMRELNNVMPALITGLGQLSGVASGSTKVQDALNRHANTVRGMTELEQSNIDAQKKKAAADANRRSAEYSAISALKDFTSALMNTSTEFSKFNSTLGNAGDAALALGKNFAGVGLIIGGLIKGATKVIQLSTVQADNALKVTDEFNKMGSAGAFTAKQLANMSIDIGLSNEQFNLLPKALRKAGDGIVGLGTTTAKGQEAFAKLLAVTNSEREAFQRLGISQEELMGKQAEYIALQGMSGKSLVSQAKDSDKLRKSSLEYTENLLRLSALTGKDADKIAKDQQLANMQYEEVIRTRVEDDKIRKLTQEGRTAEAESLQDEQKARKQFITDATSRFGEETGLQLAKVARTGAFDESTKGIAQLGIDATELAVKLKNAKPGEEVAELFNNTAETVKTRVGEKLSNFETSLQFGGEELGKVLGLNKELILNTGRIVERNEKEAERLAKLGIKKPSEGTTGETTTEDPAQKARNLLTTTTIEFNKALERGLLEVNPLLSGFNSLTTAVTALTVAALAAAAALAAIAAKSALGKVLGTDTMPDSDGGKGKGKGLGGAKRIASGLAKGGALAVGGMVLGAGADYAKEQGHEKTGTGLDVAGKAASYAGMGAMVGSVVPGLGTAAGAIVGGVVGTGMGLYDNRKTIFGSGSSAPAATPVAMGNEGNRGAKPTPQPPEGSEDKNVSAKSVDIGKILKFGSGSGSKENFDGLNSTFKDAVIAAATEYNAVTGNMIMINSAKRESEDQQRLYDETVTAGRPGRGPTGMAVGKPGSSLHEKGQAVDIQNYKDPAAIAAFNKQGLSQKVPNDPVHFQARDGAMVSGPSSGYPVKATFHGPEIVAPLDPDSILTKLSKMSASEMERSTSTNTSINSTTENIISSNAEMIDLMKMFVERMDDFIDAQADSNSIQSELLQYSKV